MAVRWSDGKDGREEERQTHLKGRGAVAEWQYGRMAVWQNGRMAVWQNGVKLEWWNGRMAKRQSSRVAGRWSDGKDGREEERQTHLKGRGAVTEWQNG